MFCRQYHEWERLALCIGKQLGLKGSSLQENVASNFPSFCLVGVVTLDVKSVSTS